GTAGLRRDGHLGRPGCGAGPVVDPPGLSSVRRRRSPCVAPVSVHEQPGEQHEPDSEVVRGELPCRGEPSAVQQCLDLPLHGVAGSYSEGMTTADAAPDLKPRSRVVTDGIEATASRGMLRAVGMGDEDWVKPQIGIASSWNEITPCNLSLDRLAQASKEGVHAGGGYPLEFGTISVS